jgi:hypothetical protein
MAYSYLSAGGRYAQEYHHHQNNSVYLDPGANLIEEYGEEDHFNPDGMVIS